MYSPFTLEANYNGEMTAYNIPHTMCHELSRLRGFMRENNQFWDRFDTKTAKVSEALNDTYLKANSQADGVKSYGRVVDLLLAWYHQ